MLKKFGESDDLYEKGYYERDVTCFYEQNVIAKNKGLAVH